MDRGKDKIEKCSGDTANDAATSSSKALEQQSLDAQNNMNAMESKWPYWGFIYVIPCMRIGKR